MRALLRFLLRRVVLGVFVLWVGTFLTFCYFASEYQPLKERPLLSAYWQWLRGVPTGASLSRGLAGPLWPVVVPALEHTALLLAYSFVLVVVGALSLGSLAAARRGRRTDGVIRGVSYVGWAVPPFILALVLLQFFGGRNGPTGLPWFPPGGWAGKCPGGLGIDLHTFHCPPAGNGIDHALNVLWFLTLPAIALAVGFIGLHARYLRSGLVQALDSSYITTGRAKGLSERRIVFRHALRNSLVVFVPGLLTEFGAIFGASLAVDLVFNLGGIGSLFYGVLNINSTSNFLDAYAAQLLLLIGGIFVLAMSIMGELTVGFLDPRVELR